MTVYIEYVLINNVIIDYCILKAAFTATGKRAKKGRLFLCAFLGALLALLFPLLNFNSIILFFLKVASGELLLVLAGDFSSIKELFVRSVFFFALTFAFFGAVESVATLAFIDTSQELYVLLIFIPVFAAYKLFSSVILYVYRRKVVEKRKVKVRVLCGKTDLNLDAFIDSGNGVYDEGIPVVFCSPAVGKKILSETFPPPKMKKLKIKTISGEKELPSIVLDEISVFFSAKPHTFKKITACFSKEISGQGYDVILHPDMEEENCRIDEKEMKNERYGKTEKVS